MGLRLGILTLAAQCLSMAMVMTDPIPGQLLAKTVSYYLDTRRRSEGTVYLCGGLAGFPSTLLLPAGNSEKEPLGRKWKQASIEVKNVGFRVRHLDLSSSSSVY